LYNAGKRKSHKEYEKRKKGESAKNEKRAKVRKTKKGRSAESEKYERHYQPGVEKNPFRTFESNFVFRIGYVF
jgi:hypothetical protein